MAEEYIGREALIKGIVDIINTAPMIYAGGLGLALNSVRSAPAADVEPVRHGRWIIGATMHHDWMKCSECLVSQDLNGCFSYCPNCGARLDLEADDGK